MTIATVEVKKLIHNGGDIYLSEYRLMKEGLVEIFNLQPKDLIKVFVPAVGDRIFELDQQLNPIDSNEYWWSYGEGPPDKWEYESNYTWVEHHEYNLTSYYVETEWTHGILVNIYWHKQKTVQKTLQCGLYETIEQASSSSWSFTP